jgi:outer membrane murein-binding lipoprotein Lpp
MKRIKITVAALLIGGIGFLSSCDSASTNNDSKNLEEFEAYVNELSTETEANWEEVEREYIVKRNKVSDEVGQLSDESKKEFEELKDKYETMKADANSKMDEMEANERAAKINEMYMIVQSNDRNMDLSNVTAENIKDVYANFVTYIDNNQDAMSNEDWKEAELIWDALNERKNVVEPNLKSENNQEIAKTKVKYAALKVANKPGAKADEKNATEKEREMKK